MKKNRLLIVVVLVLSVLAIWLYLNQKNSTINKELRDFAIKDTASVVKIFMASKSGEQVLLEKKADGTWSLNGKYWARPDAVKTLLKTMYDVEVRSPVGRAAYNNIIKSIAAKGIKVETYNSQGLFKTYYVGGPTQDQLGTYMYIENSTVPFITHIPGFEGYLTPRYITDEKDWIVKNVFKLDEGALKSIMVADREKQGYAFRITKEQTGDYSVFDGNDSPVENVSQDKVISYLQFYRILNYEYTEKTLSAEQLDSLRATTPFRSIVLTENNDKTTRVDLWRRPITEMTVNKAMEDGTPFPFDIDRMTASINGDTALVVVQYFSFDKLFRNPVDFQVSNRK